MKRKRQRNVTQGGSFRLDERLCNNMTRQKGPIIDENPRISLSDRLESLGVGEDENKQQPQFPQEQGLSAPSTPQPRDNQAPQTTSPPTSMHSMIQAN